MSGSPGAPEPDRFRRLVERLVELTPALVQAGSPGGAVQAALPALREVAGVQRCWVLATDVVSPSARVWFEALAPDLDGTPPGSEAYELRERAALACISETDFCSGPPEQLEGGVGAAMTATGVEWCALAPITLRGEPWGVLAFESDADSAWPESDVLALRLAAEALGAAVGRTRDERALHASEQRFRKMADEAADLIAEVDENVRYLYLSPSHAAVYGVDPEDLLGDSALDRIHPDDRQSTLRTFMGSFEKGAGAASFRVRHEDGSWHWVEASASFFQTEDGSNRAVLVGRDVTERRQAAEDLERITHAMDQAGEAIVIFGVDGRVQYANQTWVEQTGVPRAQAIGRRVIGVGDPKVSPQVVKDIQREVGRGHAWRGRMPTRIGDGEIGELLTSITPVRDSEGRITHFISVMRDVTHEMKLEEQIRQQQKLQAIGTLASGVAHDFNNLLTAVLGHTELLEAHAKEDPDILEAAEVIAGAARRGAELTSQLLGFALQSSPRNEAVDVHATLDEVIRLLERTLPSQIRIRKSAEAKRAVVSSDPGQLQQVFLNLAINARDAMPDGGEIVFTTRTDSLDGKACLLVEVSDSGTGIPEELRERIFEPFFSTKPRGKGTGLGLAVVYGIIQAHSGSILLRTEEGHGTTLGVRLPLRASDRRESVDADEGVVRGQGHVLLADDEPAVLRVAERMLVSLGYRVTTARDGAMAVDAFREQPDAFDLVILDLDMPQLDGRRSALAVHEIRPEVPVVLTTGMPVDILDEPEGLVQGLLLKPYELRTLSTVVATALEPDAAPSR